MADEGQPAPRRHVNATSLQGLAHPLRVQLLDELTIHGPATATQLAARLGESSGATSYHLRQLEKYGFVEEDPDRGSKRERWWRRVPGGITINSVELADSPATRDATQIVLDEFLRAKQARIAKWRSTYDRWSREWAESSWEASAHLRVTAAELDEIGRAIDDVVSGWAERTRDRQGEGVVDVEIQSYAFPVGDPPDAEPA